MKEMLDSVVRRVPDCLVEATAPVRRSDHIPQTNPATGKYLQLRLVAKVLQLLVDRASKQAPELVRRMCIILACRKRSVARQASQHEQPGIDARNRRKAGFYAQ